MACGDENMPESAESGGAAQRDRRKIIGVVAMVALAAIWIFAAVQILSNDWDRQTVVYLLLSFAGIVALISLRIKSRKTRRHGRYRRNR